MSKPETAGWCPLMNVCDRGCEQGSSRTQMTRCVRAIEAAKLPSDPMAPIPEAKSETAEPSLAEWESPQVRLVYGILCDGLQPPNPEEHWEGWTARRIVAELLPELANG